MSKRLLKYSSFNILTSVLLLFCTSALFTGCAPKVVLPPTEYKDMELTLEEIIAIARKDVDTLKTIVGINIEKDDKPHSYVDASVLLKKPDWIQIRLYKFGIPVGNFLLKDNVVYNLSDRGGEVSQGSSKLDEKLSRNLKEFIKELYRSVFWWEGIIISDCRFQMIDCKENTVISRNEMEYIIKTKDREIHLDSATLLPKSQEVTINNKKIFIFYDDPKKEGDFWYPSTLKIEAGNYRFSLKVEKLFVNPPLEENDFKEPTLKESTSVSE